MPAWERRLNYIAFNGSSRMEPTRVTLTLALLEALRAPLIVSHRSVDKAAVIRRLLAAHSTRVVVFDEIQHLCYSRRRDRLVVLDTIKAVSTDHQLNVICAGTNGVEREFLAAPQLASRFDIAMLTPWRADSAFKGFLGTYERIRPLRLPSRLTEPDMMITPELISVQRTDPARVHEARRAAQCASDKDERPKHSIPIDPLGAHPEAPPAAVQP